MKRSTTRGRPRPRASERPLNPTVFFAVLAALVCVGAVLRILAAQGELWLDEIWSYRLAHLAASPLAIVTGLHNDNNHYLNTLYLRLIPAGTSSWWVYRLPAIVLGSVTIALAALIARRRSAWAALAAATLTATSFLLIVYSSEARGYAMAVCFAFASVAAVDRYFSTARLHWGLAASLCATLGLLGHLTFLHALAGIVVWAAVRSYRTTGRRVLRDLVVLFTLPALVVSLLYWFDLRLLQLGGGPLTSPGDIAANALSLAVGGPESGGWKIIATLAAFLAAIASLASVHRSGSDLWILFLVTVILAPALTLAVVDTGVIYERYLVVALAFMTLSYAWLLDRIAYRSVALAAALAVAFVAANTVATWRFIDAGRSHYTAAMRDIVDRGGGSRATLGSDHDFRNGRVVEFYQPFVAGADRIVYEPQGQWSAGGPEWLLTHRIEPVFTPRQEITVLGGYRYRLVQSYPYAGVSGWHLALYRNLRGVQLP